MRLLRRFRREGGERREGETEVPLDDDGPVINADDGERREGAVYAVRRARLRVADGAGPLHVAGRGARGDEPVVARAIVARWAGNWIFTPSSNSNQFSFAPVASLMVAVPSQRRRM